jgi:phospholipid/cholesterol/gamma-HCH transport system substrate-binding protein
METRAQHVLIGLFTLLALVGALLFALWLGKSSVDRGFKEYEVVFEEAVTGLSRGNAVQYSGIKVGEVTQLRLDPEDPRRVLTRIRLSADTPVTEATRAKLALTGLTGNSIIQLRGGAPGSPALATSEEHLGVIVADPSPIARLLENGEDLMTNLSTFVINANQLLSTENVGYVGRTLENAEQFSAVLAEQGEAVRQLVQQLNGASAQAEQTLTQSAQLMGRANALLDKQGRHLLDSGQQTLAALERSAAQVEGLLNDNHEALNSGMQGLSTLGPTLNELRETLGALRGIVRNLEANPAGYLLGRDTIEEFEP